MTVKVETLEDLVQITELRDVVFHELSGKRSGEDSAEPEPLATRVLIRNDEDVLGVRFQANLKCYGGSYVADAEVVFSLREQPEIEPVALREFVERVAMMAVYPYLRAAIADTATRLSLQRPVLGLLRSNEVHLYRDENQVDDEAQESSGKTPADTD